AEQRLVLTMIAKIQPDDCDFKPYRISVSELADFLGVDKNSAYRECRKITKSLLTRVLEIYEPDRLLQTSWVSSAEYVNGSGIVNLSFDPLLKPYLLKLKGNFTSCKLEMLLSFKSQYTMRMYTLLKQYGWRKEREIELHEIREILGLRKDLYTEYSNFKLNVLLPTQKELSEKSDLTFEFDEIKNGRRVGAIRFLISPKPASAPLLPSDETHDDRTFTPEPSAVDRLSDLSVQDLLLLVPQQHRNKKTVFTALEVFSKRHGFDYVKRNILYSNAKADKSYAGFLNNALKADWGYDWDLEHNALPKNKALEVWERNGFASSREYDNFMYKKQMANYGLVIE
ncbi:replication initiation protein, partial [Methylovulum psychrotolerans]